MDFDLKTAKIGVVGLGYVGLPLALELAKYNEVIGFDVNEERIETLQNNQDFNHEMDSTLIAQSSCQFTSDANDIAACNVYIVTVPTPIDDQNNPDLSILEKASEMIGPLLNNGNIVVYESTVYPGVTEELCAPILEQTSGLSSGQDFFLGYSPERINPGDTKNTLANMAKIVAGQNETIAQILCDLYGQINNGDIFKARNIKTAEAAKAIENAQRDINVAFINEVTMILNKLGLSSYDVLEAAGTKWNFLPFTPGLVGGHCIGVDPYYLAKCALENNHNPEIILAGRSINDNMGNYFAQQLHSEMGAPGKILTLGFTFKENINDTRNTKVADLISALQNLGHEVDTHDPYAIPDEVHAEYGITLCETIKDNHYDSIVLAVNHHDYMSMQPEDISKILKNKAGIVYDIKSAWKNIIFPNQVNYLYP